MTLIITNTIFEDNCSTNKYNSYMNINNCACTVTYQNSTDGYNVDPCYNGSLISPVAVANLPKNNFELSVKIKKTISSYGYHGIGVLNGTTNQLLFQGFLWTNPPSLYVEGNLGGGQTGVTTNLNTWYTFKLRIQNNSLTLYLLDEAGTTTLWSKNYGTVSFDRYGVWIRENYAYFKDYKLILL
ncbi:hypothetical protein [Methanobrevibacter sp. UBA337]|jgi:hypothetical protein|uniref:hypothetical protein n=1 Tax=Methanobrevibacter sp. UBA337 TaxID=1915480 RepID=UPI0039B87E95